MGDIRNVSKSGKARNRRIIKLAPMTRAVRSALAVSALAFAFGAPGAALAAGPKVTVGHVLQTGQGAIDFAPVFDLTIVVGAPMALPPIDVTEPGDVSIDNADSIDVVGIYDAIAIRGYSVEGSVDIVNQADGALSADSGSGTAIGIYGYALSGEVSIDNAGDIAAKSTYGLADGIFAAGMNVDVANTGDITAIGSTWATGIEAEGAYATTVQNDGAIIAVATGVNGHANGIYATSDTGVTIGNTGDISAYGTYATGIEAQSQGGIAIDNRGNIIAEDDGYGLATAIHAISGGEGAAVSITNTGDITVQSYYGASGIVAVSGGLGGTASVTNDGNIEVTQGNKYGYAAYGIVSSADGDSTINNNGSITVTSDSPVTGAAALSFAGDASVNSSGDITVHSEAVAYYAANGIVSFAGNGHATADNSANIDVSTKYIGTGMDVNGLGGAIASSSGDISVDAWRAYGIHAQSGNGDVSVDNGGSIYATYTGTNFAGTAFGILGTSVNGNVAISNSGDIATLVQDQSVGIFGRSDHGDVSVTNDGTIYAYSADGYAVGVFARADEGAVSVDSSASIEAYSYNGYAFGVLARGDVVDVDNSGDISANGLYEATGIAASSFSGTTVTSSGDAISAFAVGAATGIDAQSAGGNVTVTNASDIEATGMVLGARGILAAGGYDVAIDNSGDIAVLSMDGDATGIFGYSLAGKTSIGNSGAIEAASYNGDAIGIYGYSLADDVTIDNSGDLTAASVYGLADGIFASGQDVDVTNSGAITAEGYLWAAGIEAEGSNSTQVHNSGDISASVMPFIQVEYNGGVLGSADGGQAFGIYATAGVGGAAITNSGNIMVDGGYATGIEVHSEGNLSITNSGDIAAGSGLSAYYNSGNYYAYYYGTQVATGINAASNGEGAHVVVSNSGDIAADGIFGASGIAAVSSGYGGTAGVSNSGNITVSQNQKYGYGAYGIVTSADGDSFIDNSGIVEVYSGGVANGLAALSFAGDAGVVNSGDITAVGIATGYYGATGILAFAANGSAYVNNSGSVTADWSGALYASARAVDAQGLQGVLVKNSGSLYASGKYAYGVYAASAGGDVAVHNEDDGEIGFSSSSNGFGVLGVATTGDVAIINDGAISGYALGQSTGIFSIALEGDVDVGNYGSIDIVTGGSAAAGAFARADYGTATVVNGGDISVSVFPGTDYRGYDAYGILATSDYGYAAAGNSGSITADGYYSATGIAARSYHGTTVTTAATSQIEASADVAIGIEGRAEAGNVTVDNAGGIATAGAYGSVGIQAYSAMGDVTVGNTGHIDAASEYGIAIGATGLTMAGNVAMSNGGLIEAASSISSYGILAQTYAGNVVVNNASNGRVEVSGGVEAIGILVNSVDGDSTVNNAGVIHAGDAYYATGVMFEGLLGNNTLNNLGTGIISADGNEGHAFAVVGGDAADTINNSGRILGAISLYGGADVFNNKAGGVWDVGDSRSTDFGDGDDAINNQAGGTIRLAGGALYLGSASSAGNAFTNAGTIKVVGDDNLIDMGSGIALVPALNPLPLVNNGIIDFVDGATDDVLTIEGDLGGSGAINVDMDLAILTSDQLYVDGSMASGVAQKVNVSITQMPETASTTAVEFAHVAGTSSAGAFVGGALVGYSPSNFLDIGVHTSRQAGAGDSASFLVSLDVLGLNDTGALAAATASGAAAFMNAQVGTFRQRLGVNPYGDAGKVMNAFVRFYSSEGDVDLAHTAGNFGQGGNFGFSQKTWGKEFGINANLSEKIHAGLVFGNADSRQRLSEGVGENRMDGATVGAYATWQAPEGFYVDLTGRWMAADIRATSAAGVMVGRVHTQATSLEAGYEWKVGSFNVVPQAQYTSTKVDGIRAFHGQMADFEAHGGTFSQGRLGVEINRTIQSGDLRWTPYGALSAVREFEGKTTYTVADNFFGSTSSKGTSAMAELGLGLQKGAFGFGVGVNWTDGGAYKSVVGGQANVRFSW